MTLFLEMSIFKMGERNTLPACSSGSFSVHCVSRFQQGAPKIISKQYKKLPVTAKYLCSSHSNITALVLGISVGFSAVSAEFPVWEKAVSLGRVVMGPQEKRQKVLWHQAAVKAQSPSKHRRQKEARFFLPQPCPYPLCSVPLFPLFLLQALIGSSQLSDRKLKGSVSCTCPLGAQTQEQESAALPMGKIQSQWYKKFFSPGWVWRLLKAAKTWQDYKGMT